MIIQQTLASHVESITAHIAQTTRIAMRAVLDLHFKIKIMLLPALCALITAVYAIIQLME